MRTLTCVSRPPCFNHKFLRYTFPLMVIVGITLAVTGAPALHAQTYNVLYSFTGGADGGFPVSAVTVDSGGNIYGTTRNYGDATCRCGTVFKIDTTGTFSVIHAFTGGTDGKNPLQGLIADSSGNFYGTTSAGGSSGDGTVFKIDSSGTESILYNFSGPDGNSPMGLTLDAAGNIYGVTPLGGNINHACGNSGCGLLYKLTQSGVQTVLYAFMGGSTDGFNPIGSPYIDAEGNIYGATRDGGSPNNTGTVYKYAADGTITRRPLGIRPKPTTPLGGLIRDAAGNFYGPAYGGEKGAGTIFRADATGNPTGFFSFNVTDGEVPNDGLVLDGLGNLYGTTIIGGTGSGDWGTVFKLSTSGETILYSFQAGTDGASPVAGLAIDLAGNLYGTAKVAGAYGYGVVFEVVP